MRNTINNIRRIYTYTQIKEEINIQKMIKTEIRYISNKLYN